MKELNTKDQLIRYLLTFDPPEILVKEKLNIVRWDHTDLEWRWSIGILKGCSLDLLTKIIDSCEELYG